MFDMKKTRLVVIACTTLVASCHNSAQEPLEPGALLVSNVTKSQGPKADSRIERGAYLSKILGCKYCHAAVGSNGPDFSRPFAGGFEVKEKFGTWRAPNITQDNDHGIGKWTDDEIASAIREGIRRDGTPLYPVMPYLNFNRMTDDDVSSLVAYLRTVPAIDNAVPMNTNLELPQPHAPKPMNALDSVSDPVKHGEYLVTIMNCSMCHTPLGKDGMPDMAKQFAGGVEIEIPSLGIGKLYSSNITSDPDTGLGNWTEADFEKAVTVPGVGGGRIELYLTGKNPMSKQDLTAIAAYLKTIPPVRNAVPASDFKATFARYVGRGTNKGGRSTIVESPLATAKR